jgi:glycosyltransferase involved in cell wall biosynthesis
VLSTSQAAPLITIVTSTFNARGALERTAASIRAQTYGSIQWIVIDGGSRDGTVDEIRANAASIDYWVSEPDQGIYDAWNKGCARIAGEWVMFIGAGDELAAPDTLARCAPYLAEAAGKHDIVYGRIELVTEGGEVVAVLGEPWERLKGRWGGLLPLLPPHPGSFHHRSLFRGARSFDTHYRYAGDSAFVVESVLRRDPLYIPVLVDRMLTGGVTVRPDNIARLARERREISRRLPVRPPLLHRLGWHASIAALLAAHALLPARVRRGVGRLLRGGGNGVA